MAAKSQFTSKPPDGRRRNAAATRQALLEAAQRLFTREGFDESSSRKIAAEAGVNVALVNRYFGSKEGLLAATMAESFSIESFFGAGKAGFAKSLARYVVTKAKQRGRFDPLLVMLRSVSNPRANRLLNRAAETQFTQPLADWLGGADAELRASLILAWLSGFDLIRNVLCHGPLSKADSDELVQRLAAVIQSSVQ